MIVAALLTALGLWAISLDAIASGVGCMLWGCAYVLWWWRARRSASERSGLAGRALLPAIAACALAGLVTVVLQRIPAVSPFATLLAEVPSPAPSLGTLAIVLPPVLLLGLVILLARDRRAGGVE